MQTVSSLRESRTLLNYLLPHEQTFWRWSREAKAVEWRDGRTIAFREEVQAILHRLAPGGLPPFGAIVLLLAAMRDNWNEQDDKAARILAGDSAPMNAASPPGTIVIIGSLVPHRPRQGGWDMLGGPQSRAGGPGHPPRH